LYGDDGLFEFSPDSDLTTLVDNIFVVEIETVENKALLWGFDIENENIDGLTLYGLDCTDTSTSILVQGAKYTRVNSFAVVDTIWLYTASTPENGNELFRTDGTPEGTYLLADIETGVQSSSILTKIQTGNTIYFETRNVDGKFDLWRTNGFISGTYKLSKNVQNTIYEGFEFPFPKSSHCNQIIFQTRVNDHTTIAMTNKIGGGISLPLYNGVSTPSISNVFPLGALDDGFYFTGRTEELGTALYRIDLSETAPEGVNLIAY
jgi:ELWxxDGT repeat protein